MAATKVAFINVSVFTQFPSSSPAYHHRVTQCVTIINIRTSHLTSLIYEIILILKYFSQQTWVKTVEVFILISCGDCGYCGQWGEVTKSNDMNQ